MAQAVANWILSVLAGVPDFFKVIVLAMVPLTEYRLAIPVAIEQFHFSIPVAFLLSFIGTSAIFFLFYFALDAIRKFLGHAAPGILRPIDAFFDHAKKKVGPNYEKYGILALFLLIAVPVPLTGVWTATFAAVALKIPLKPALAGILGGLVVGEIIVTILTIVAQRAIG